MMKNRIRQQVAGFGLSVFLTAAALGGCAAPIKNEEDTRATDISPTKETKVAKEPATQGEVQEPLFQVPSFSKDRYPRVDGSTATLPLSIALYQQSTGVSNEEAQAAIVHTKTDNAYYNLMYQGADLLLVYEASPEVKGYIEDEENPLLIEPIGKDALVFLANQGNPVLTLTKEQIADIYSGNIKEWSQVGGKDWPIQAFQRPENSGSQTMMKKLVMKGRDMDQAPTVKILDSMGALIEGVASYDNKKNALGYSVYFYAKNMYEKPELKFMAVDGVMPSNAAIKSGKYPYVNEFYAVIRKDEPENSPARQLFQWLTTEDGQLFVETMGYVGVKEIKTGQANQSDSISTQIPLESIQLPLREDERIIMTGEMIIDSATGIILDRNMNREEFPEGVTSADNQVKQIDLAEPQIMSDSATGLRGIYSFKEKRWMVQPEYVSFYFDQNNNCYTGYTSDWNTRVWIDKDFHEIYRGSGTLLQNYIWIEKETGKFDVLDLNGKLLKSLDFTGNKGYHFTYDSFGYMVADFDNEFQIYGSDGNLVFEKEHIPSQYYPENRITLAGISGDRKCINFIYSDKGTFHSVMYSLKSGKLVPSKDRDRGLGYKGDTWYYKDDDLCYDTEGNQMFTASGNPVTVIADNGWMGYKPEQGMCVLENENGSKSYTLLYDLDEIVDVQSLPGDCFSLSDPNNNFIFYQGDQEAFRGSYLFDWEKNGYTVVSPYEFEGNTQKMLSQMVFGKDGQLVYETVAGENIMDVGDGYVVTIRGNYIYLFTWGGECGFSMLQGYMNSD